MVQINGIEIASDIPNVRKIFIYIRAVEIPVMFRWKTPFFILMCTLLGEFIGCTTAPEKPVLPDGPPEHIILEYTDSGDEWPPRPKNATHVHLVPWRETSLSINDDLEADLIGSALRDLRVRTMLGSRFTHISTDEIEPSKAPQKQSLEQEQILLSRLTFFSHTNNVAVEVYLKGVAVQDVRGRRGYQPPVGPVEVQLAIELAQLDPRLQSRVRGLYGAALVSSINDDEPGFGNRVLSVTFSKKRGGRPLYRALVDLTTQRVLLASEVKGT